MSLKVISNPFMPIENAVHAIYREGLSIQDIINENVEQRYHDFITVYLNDLSVNDYNILLKPDDRLDITVRPKGTGDGKDNLRMGLTVIVMVLAAVASAYTGPIAGPVAAGLVGAAVSIGGVILINALLPIKTPDELSNESSPTYQLTGGQNRANPWGTVPTVLGKMRVAPFFGAQSYLENSADGTKQNFIGLYVWGYGNIAPLWLSENSAKNELKIGNDPIVNYRGYIDHLTRIFGNFKNEDRAIYNGTVVTQQYNVELPNDTEKIITTGDFSNYTDFNMDISFDLAFPSGIFGINDDGKTIQKVVSFEAAYRKSGSNDEWMDLLKPQYVASHAVCLGGYRGGMIMKSSGTIDIDENGKTGINRGKTPLYTYKTITKSVGNWESGYRKVSEPAIDKDMRPQEWKEKGYFSFKKLEKRCIDFDWEWGCRSHAYFVVINSGYVLGKNLKFDNAIRNTLTYSIKIPDLPCGQYDLKIKRVSGDDVMNKSYLSTVKVSIPTPAITFPYPLMVTELKAEASKQLNGSINTLTGVIQTLGKVYKDGAWQEEREPTSNPASLIIEVLMGYCNPRPVKEEQIDWDNFAEFYEHCEHNGFEYNRYHENKTDLQNVLNEIAAAGRAYIGQPDGKYYVYIDGPGKVATQLFNNDNILEGSFNSRKLFANLPHALRCTFKNENNDYKSDERIVYFDNYNESNATLFESMDFPYITNPDLIYRFAREYMKAAALRNEQFTFQVSHDVLRCKRRDLIHLASDVIMVGKSYGSIKGIDGDKIKLWEPVFFDADKNYTLDIRITNVDGDTEVIQVKASGEGETDIITCDTSKLKAGMLYTFGENKKIYEECIITNIVIGEDLIATVTCVPYAPEIYNDPNDPIPPHIPIVDTEQDKPFIKPAIPYFESFSESIVKEGGTVLPLLVINWNVDESPVNIKSYDLEVKTPQSTTWQNLGELTNKNYQFKGYEYGKYSFRVRAVSDYFVTSPWTEASANLYGISLPLNNVKGITSRLQADFNQVLTWDYIEDFRDITYEVRRGDSWSKGELIGITDLNFMALNFNGQYWVKAKVRGQNVYSKEPAGLLVESSDLLTRNVIVNYEESPTWMGQKKYCTILNKRLIFNASEQGSMYAIYTIPSERIISLASKESCNIKINFTVASSLDYNFYEERVYSLENVYGKEASGLYKITPQISIDEGEWQNFTAGMYLGEHFNFRLYMEVKDAKVDLEIIDFSYSVDVPDRIQTFYKKKVENGELILEFEPPFNAPPTVVINILNAQEGDTVILSESTKEKVDIKIKNSGQLVERYANIIVQGY